MEVLELAVPCLRVLELAVPIPTRLFPSYPHGSLTDLLQVFTQMSPSQPPI